MKEGNNAEKLSNTSKQVPVSSEPAKDIGSSPVEADTTNLLSTSLVLDSQTKMEIDNVPSSSNANKNPTIKFGKYHSLSF